MVLRGALTIPAQPRARQPGAYPVETQQEHRRLQPSEHSFEGIRGKKELFSVESLIYKIARNPESLSRSSFRAVWCAGNRPTRKEARLNNRQIPVAINGRQMLVNEGTSVAAAVMMAGEACRYSVHGQPRAALSGMGVCMECRMTIDGVPHRRACQLLCAPGMEVVTE